MLGEAQSEPLKRLGVKMYLDDGIMHGKEKKKKRKKHLPFIFVECWQRGLALTLKAPCSCFFVLDVYWVTLLEKGEIT